MKQKEIEKQSLMVSVLVNLIITGAGIWVFAVTKIQVLFLDAFFSLIGLLSTVLAIIMAKNSQKKTKSYPDGLYFLEPLYAILKSLLILGLLIVSVVGTSRTAYAYFSTGIGEAMHLDPVLPYAVSMVVLCFGLSYFNYAQNKKINHVSTILEVESKSNFIDGLQSLSIGFAIFFLYFIDINGPLGFLHYTGDFFVTSALVLLSVEQPIKILILSFKELSNGTTSDKEIKEQVTRVLTPHLSHLPSDTRLDIFKVGTHLKIRITLAPGGKVYSYKTYNKLRKKIIADLNTYYDSIDLVFIL